MHPTGSWAFLAVAVVLVLVPGPDTAVVLRNTLAGGRPRGPGFGARLATGRG